MAADCPQKANKDAKAVEVESDDEPVNLAMMVDAEEDDDWEEVRHGGTGRCAGESSDGIQLTKVAD